MLGFHQVSVWIFGDEGDILAEPRTQALIVASSVLVTGSMLVSPLIADLATVFSVSESSAGWLIVSFTAAAAVALPIVGALADRIGRKPIMTAGLVLFGITGAAVGSVARFEAALVLRMLQGVGYACAAPLILTLFGDIYQGSRETTVQGMRVSVNGAINTAVPLVASILFGYSWRYPFAIYLIALPAAILVWVYVPRTAKTNSGSFSVYLRKITAFLSTVEISLLMVSFMLRFVLFYGLITYISVLAIQEVGLAVVGVGALLSIRGIVKTLSSTQAGRLSLSYDPAVLALTSFIFLAVGITLMGAFPTTETMAIGITIVGISDGILSPSQKSLVNQISPPEYRGGMTSTAMTFQNIGKVVGPAGLGVVLGIIGPASAFVLLGIVGGGIGAGALFGVVTGQDSSQSLLGR